MSNQRALPSLSFGAQLKHLRRSANLSQRALAGLTDYTVGYISKLESGQRNPAPITIEHLASALALSPEQYDAFFQAAGAAFHMPRITPFSSWPSAQQSSESSPTSPASSWPKRRAEGPEQGGHAGHADATIFVGRQRELARIEALLAGEGRPSLLLAGEPGMGKSRLLRRAAEQGMVMGWTVFAGASLRHDWQEPYAPLLGIFERLVNQQSEAARTALLSGSAWLVRLLPELAQSIEMPPEPAIVLAEESPLHYRLISAAARLLANSAGPSGSLLVIDDLHWAGPRSFDLLVALLRLPLGLAGPPVRLIGAYRQTEQPGTEAANNFVADLVSAGLTDLLTLETLSAREAGVLVDALLPEPLASDGRTRDMLLRRTGGVPFFLVSAAQTVLAEPPPAAAGGAGARDAHFVPWEVAQTVRQRLAVLPEAARLAVRTTALAGLPASSSLLLHVGIALEQSETAILHGIELACRAGLLAECGTALTYSIPYPLLIDVIVADVGAAQRTRLHQLIAEALLAVDSAPPLRLLAHHFLLGGIPDKIVEYLHKAGDEAIASAAYSEAASCYDELANQLDSLGRHVDAANARFELTHALYHLNDYAQGLRVLEKMAQVFERADEREALAQTAAAAGWTYAAMGTPAPGIARIERIIAQALPPRTLSTRTRAGLFISLANLYQVAGRYGLQYAAAQHALDLAQILGNSQLIAQALAYRASAWYRLNLVDEGMSSFEQEVIALARTTEDYWTLTYAFNTLANDHLMRGKFRRSYHFAQRALNAAEQAHDPGLLALMLLRRGSLDFYRGRWTNARRFIQKGLDTLGQTESAHTPYGRVILARLLLAEGDRTHANELMSAGLEQAQKIGDMQVLRLGHAVLAERELLLGQPDAATAALAAMDRLRPLLDRQDEQEETDVTPLLPLVCWAWLNLNDFDQARTLMESTIRRARQSGMACALVDALRVRALLALRQEEWMEAASALDEAMLWARKMPFPYAQATLLYTRGLLHIAQGNAPCATQQLEEALAILTPLRERLYAERIERELAALKPPC